MKRKHRILTSIGILILSIAIFVYATDLGNWGYRITWDTSMIARINNLWNIINWIIRSNIPEHGTVKEINNFSCTNDVFVPSKTSAAFSSWYNASHTCYNITTMPQPLCGSTSNTCVIWTVSNEFTLLWPCDTNCDVWEREETDTRDCSNLQWSKSCTYDKWCILDLDNCNDLACLIAWTEITMADWSYKDIVKVQTWDKILDSNNKINTVIKTYKIRYQRKLYAFNNSKHYFVSDSHPFLTTEWWKSFNPRLTKLESPDLKVSKLKTGDTLITTHWLEKLSNIDTIIKPWYVYNFKTNGTHEYIADGYVVHNPLQK